MSKRTLVITGANGFIGVNLIHEAKHRNWHVKGIVRRPDAAGYIKKMGAEPVIISDLDDIAYRNAFTGCTAVVHLIGIINEKTTTYQKAHVESTRIVLESAESEGLNRVINVSGLGVDLYGKTDWANNPYFGSKLDAERLLPKYSIPFVNFRPTYIFGPESYWFSSLFRGIKKGRINMIGDGLIPMQPVYVKDVVHSFLAATEGLGKNNVHYDMVGPEVTNMRDIVQRVIRYFQKINKLKNNVEIHHIPYSEAPKRLKISKEKASVSQCDLLGDTTPLIRDLGVKMTPLNQAIKYTIRNFHLS